MSTSTPKAEPASEAAPKKKGKGKLIIIAVAALAVLAGGGAGAWMFLKKPHDGKAAHKKEEKKKAPPVFVNLEPFTVNLQPDQEDAHYLQTDIVLQVADEKMVEPIKVQMPIIRSSILLLLSSKSAQELGSAQGKRKLAQEIIGETSKHLALADVSGEVENIHFSSFVIQ
jgi:flagellar protein FliL